MNGQRRPRRALRRFAESQVMRALALLVALLLPLHGIANAISSIQRPAHYHLAAHLDPFPLGPTHADARAHVDANWHDALDGSPEHKQDPNAQVPNQGLAEHQDHDHDHDHDHAHEHKYQSDSTVGHHAHALDAGDVVYVVGDADSADEGAAGKHVATGAEAMLPAWSMPSLATFGRQLLPECASAFRSHPVTPLLRPPSCVGAFPA